MPKIYFITDGSLENGCEHLILPEGMDIKEELIKYKQTVKYTSTYGFANWLKAKGAREPSEDELVEFDIND